jgi:hypothetical protein
MSAPLTFSEQTVRRQIEAGDARRKAAHEAEARRYSGVRWAGMGPEPFRPMSDEVICEAVRRRMEGLNDPEAVLKRQLFRLACEGSYEADAIYSAASRGDAGWQDRAREILNSNQTKAA